MRSAMLMNATALVTVAGVGRDELILMRRKAARTPAVSKTRRRARRVDIDEEDGGKDGGAA